jgi:hypothetical protein
MHCCAQWCNLRNGCPAKLLINTQIYVPGHSHNDGVPCSNQGVATIFGLLRVAIAALEFRARRSRTGLYCSRHCVKFRLALASVATAKKLR